MRNLFFKLYQSDKKMKDDLKCCFTKNKGIIKCLILSTPQMYGWKTLSFQVNNVD
jgi:hypothetical protein